MNLEEIEQVVNDIRFEEVRESELAQMIHAINNKKPTSEDRMTISSDGYNCYVSTHSFLVLVTRELDEVRNKIASLKAKIGVN